MEAQETGPPTDKARGLGPPTDEAHPLDRMAALAPPAPSQAIGSGTGSSSLDPSLPQHARMVQLAGLPILPSRGLPLNPMQTQMAQRLVMAQMGQMNPWTLQAQVRRGARMEGEGRGDRGVSSPTEREGGGDGGMQQHLKGMRRRIGTDATTSY